MKTAPEIETLQKAIRQAVAGWTAQVPGLQELSLADTIITGPLASLLSNVMADKSCIEADQAEISYLHARLAKAESLTLSLAAELGRALSERNVAMVERDDERRYSKRLEAEQDEASAQHILLATRVEQLEAALKPFCFGDPTLEAILYDGMPDSATGTFTISLGDLRRARAALSGGADAKR